MDLQFMDDLLADNTEWQITDDGKADWAIEKVNEAIAERDRLVKIAQDKIKELQDKVGMLVGGCNAKTQYLTDKLFGYFQTITPTATKTQSTYKLLSGKLVLKHQQPEYTVNQSDALAWAAVSAPEFIKVEKTFTWGAYKKYTEVQGENVVSTETGEVIPGVVAKAREDIFEVAKA